MKIKSFIKEKFQSITWLNEKYTNWKWREREISAGVEYPDKVFYVIRRASCKVGLFSYVMTNLGMIEYAVKKGYIPIIDMQNNINTYLEENEIGKKNAWEFYFQQPCGYSLKDIKNAKHIILSNGIIDNKSVYPTEQMLKDEKNFYIWYNVSQKYLKPDVIIEKEAEQIYYDMFAGERVLGVLCRGTDYIQLKPNGHPVQPNIDQMLSKAEEMLRDTGCRWIYLATEDEAFYAAFKNKFPEVLKVSEAKRCSVQGKFNINDISYGRENDKYFRGKEYLINILLLSKCNCLLAGAVGGTYGALLLSKGYEKKYIFDLGIYY